MSNIYIQEPPTKGKVLLNTSVGDIDIELWSKEAPKACRNFVQLCLEHYYDNTIFHRIVKGFCIQGGDPTGTGTGGESIYGQPFKNEVHQRLRFVRRGLVATANTGENDNGSQFFFTLGRTDELHGKHTIFGKVTGNTIYNMLEMESMEVDQNDFPVYPPKIYKTEVLSNPFEDIVPREKEKPVDKESLNKKEKEKKNKGTKNFSLLSFGEEAEDDEEEVQTLSKEMKIKSSHDALNDPKLSSVPALETRPTNDNARIADDEVVDSVRKKLQKPKVEEMNDDHDEEDDEKDERLERRKQLRRESKRLTRELRESKKMKRDKEVDTKDEEDEKEDEEEGDVGALKEFRQERKEYLHKKNETIKKKGSGREEQTLQLLSSFQSKLEEPDEPTSHSSLNYDSEGEEEGDDSDSISWLHHKLVFEERDHKVKDANIRDEDTYEIFDPRNPINKRRREESKRTQREKRKK